MRALRIARWLLAETGYLNVASILLKLHPCPFIVLKVGSAHASLGSRTVGMHTGSRSVGAAGRIPLLDIAE